MAAPKSQADGDKKHDKGKHVGKLEVLCTEVYKVVKYPGLTESPKVMAPKFPAFKDWLEDNARRHGKGWEAMVDAGIVDKMHEVMAFLEPRLAKAKEEPKFKPYLKVEEKQIMEELLKLMQDFFGEDPTTFLFANYFCQQLAMKEEENRILKEENESLKAKLKEREMQDTMWKPEVHYVHYAQAPAQLEAELKAKHEEPSSASKRMKFDHEPTSRANHQHPNPSQMDFHFRMEDDVKPKLKDELDLFTELDFLSDQLP